MIVWHKGRRWWVRKFRTTVRPALWNPVGGKVVSEEEWRAMGEWAVLKEGWEAERPDWWTFGSTSGVTAETRVEALRCLDEWQDDMAARCATRWVA